MTSQLQIGVELTGHCDLRCRHCLREDLSTKIEFDVDLFRRIADQAVPLGRPHFAFTGGEVTLHRRFFDFAAIVAERDLSFHFVTNGNSYPAIRRALEPYHETLTGISFSLDGATAAVHDAVRGRGSFRRVLMAIALAVRDGWPVTVQMVVHAGNRHELPGVVAACEELGAAMLVVAHAQAAKRASTNNLILAPHECIAVEEEVRRLARSARIPVGLSSGHHDPTPIAHCQTLKHQSFNVDCHGRMTFCCQLSGVAGHPADSDVLADLRTTSLADAIEQHLAEALETTRARLRYLRGASEDPYRNFHCHFCMKRYGKLVHIGAPGDDNTSTKRRLRVVE